MIYPKYVANKLCCKLDLWVIYVDKHIIYPAYIKEFLKLQNIHEKIYKVHIHKNIILVKL
jgi:hypothetical protein